MAEPGSAVDAEGAAAAASGGQDAEAPVVVADHGDGELQDFYCRY